MRLVTEMGMTPAQAAGDLGCSAQAIRDWRKQAEIDAGEREGISSDERGQLQAENAELRRRTKQLEQGYLIPVTMESGPARGST